MDSYTVYFAGDLFDHKHLTGNFLLASAIERTGAGRYVCVLPQHLEQVTHRAAAIRNQDLKQVVSCDIALFNFDGTDLDSGTVVEFMMAKFLDIPSVVLRTDFRAAGDQQKDGDPWNLMCSFYPRTRIVRIHAMAWQQEAWRAGGTPDEIAGRLYKRMAGVVVEALDTVRGEPSLVAGDVSWAERLYAWAARFPGGDLSAVCTPDFLTEIVAQKHRKGLLG